MTVSPPRQAYDLILKSDTDDPIGLMLYRGTPEKRGAAQMISKYGPSNESETGVIRDVAVTMDNFIAGFGHSQRVEGSPATYAWAENLCTRSPRGVVPSGELALAAVLGPIGAVRTSFELDGGIYFCTDIGVIASSIDGVFDPTVFATLAGSFAFRSSAVFQGSAYIGGGSGTSGVHNVHRLTGSTLTELAGIARRHLVTVYSVTADNVGAERLWGTDGASSIRYTSADPSVAGNWSSSIAIGDSTYPILAMPATNRHVYPVKQDGIHDLDELGYSPNLTPAWKDVLDPNTGQAALSHEGYLYVSQGLRGMERIDLGRGSVRRDTPEWCQPGYGLPNETPINGYISASCTDQGWLVVSVHNPNNGCSYIMYGIDRRLVGLDGVGPLLWHGAETVIQGTPSQPAVVTNLRVAVPTTLGHPYLWISVFKGGETQIYRQQLPTCDSPLSDLKFGGTYRFASQGSLYTTAQDWGQQYSTQPKQIWQYDVRADNMPTGSSLDVYASDAGDTYAFDGRMTTGPRARIGPSSAVAHALALRLDLRSLASDPIIFRGLTVRAMVLAEQNEYIPYDVEFGSNVPLQNGEMDDRDAWRVKARLQRLQQSVPFMAIDHHGRRMLVRMGQGIDFNEAEGDEYGRWRIRARFLLRVLRRPIAYGSGETWGGGGQYS